jgi:hypothetical protein
MMWKCVHFVDNYEHVHMCVVCKVYMELIYTMSNVLSNCIKQIWLL